MDERDETYNEALSAIDALTQEELTTVVSYANKVLERNLLEEADAESGIPRAILEAIMVGFILGRDDSEDDQIAPDLIVGIDPEQATRLIAGLVGDGATLGLAVIRNN